MKNKLSFLIPALIVVIGIATFAMSAATNLQTWQTTTGSKVSSVDSNGSFNVNSILATATSAGSVTGSSGTASIPTSAVNTSGSVTFSEPFAGTGYKQVLIGLTSFGSSGAMTFTYPTAFTQTPLVTNTMSSGTIGAFTNAASGGTLATSSGTSTGYILLQGN